MKKILLLLLIFLRVTSYAENYKVEAEKLNIRSCASKDCEVIGLLHHGDIVNVESIVSEESGKWGQILVNGTPGYVMTDYLTIVSASNENSTKDYNILESPFFLLGIVSLIIFFILFRISYKKKLPIFIGVWDVVLLVVSAVFFAFYVNGNAIGESTATESLVLLILSLIPFLGSMILTIKATNPLEMKILSIIAKCAFVLSALALLFILMFLFFTSKTKRTDSLGRQMYDERGHAEFTDTRAWAKLKKYWKEMKDLSRMSKM